MGVDMVLMAEKCVVYLVGQVIFKSSNLLLNDDFQKMSDHGLANRRISERQYSPPKYVQTCHLLLKTDLYNFGIVLNQIITRRPNQ
ncbi:hypothetical protein YC2023_039452 [Brassica napus]